MTDAAASARRVNIALVVIGLAGTAVNLSGALGMLAMTLVALFDADIPSAQLGMWAAGSLAAMAASGVPAVVLGVHGLFHPEPARPLRPVALWILVAFGLLFPVALLSGAGILGRSELTLVAIPIHLASAILPVVFVVLLVQILGPRTSLRRLWSQFLTGLWAMPLVAILLELLALIPVVIVAVAGLAATIDVAALLEPMLETMPDAGAFDTDTATALLLNPWVLASLFGFVAGIVPLIEEAVKTLAVAPMARRLSPAEAFAGGALGGAGYALFEALFLTQPDPSWLMTMIGRGGATAMHAFTAAVTCWGISQAVHRRRWGRLALAYLSAVIMHAIWNASVIATGVAQVNQEAGAVEVPPLIESLSLSAAPLLLAALSVTALVGLALGAQLLRKAGQAASP